MGCGACGAAILGAGSAGFIANSLLAATLKTQLTGAGIENERGMIPMERKEPRVGGSPSRIVVVDDHPLFRSALGRMLDAHPDLEVVGEAADGQEAVEFCHRLQPALVLMDVWMPTMDGLEATRAIKTGLPRTIVLVLTAMEEPNYLSEALKAGAAGYVLKSTPVAEIIAAVRKALIGESPLDQEIATRLLMRRPREGAKGEEAQGGTPPPGAV